MASTKLAAPTPSPARTEPLRILVARKPGAATTDAEAYAAWLARTGPTRIRAITVLPTNWPTDDPEQLGKHHTSWIQAEEKACGKAQLAAFEDAGLEKKSIEDIEFATGPSETSAITKAATDFQADLVVIASTTTAPKGRYRMGSTADALLHCAPVPLGLAPHQPKLSKRGVRRVNCTYVDTEQSKEALRKACDLAHMWGVPVRLVAFAPRGASMYQTQTPYRHADEDMVEWREQALALLDRGRDRALQRHSELDVQIGIGTGRDWAAAMDNLEWKKGDLLVVGSSTLGVFGQVFLGSSTNQIVRHSPVPTMIVPV